MALVHLGMKGCLDAERTLIVETFAKFIENHFKIRELWHLITFDKDLSDDKIVRLGEQGQIFYLPNASETYKKCSEHQGMKNYVRPLNNFVGDIRNLI